MQGRVNLAGALSVVGAGALIVGLSLDWFEPEISAWTAFEIVDVLLAAIALGVVVGALSRAVDRRRTELGAAWLPLAAIAALALVVASLANHPPAAIDRSLEVGAWISLGGAIVLAIAAVLATTELSVVVTMRPRQRARPPAGPEAPLGADESGWEPPSGQPFEEPPPEEPATDESPVEPGHDEIIEPAEEGFALEDEEPPDEEPPDEEPPDEEPPTSSETQPFPPPRPGD